MRTTKRDATIRKNAMRYMVAQLRKARIKGHYANERVKAEMLRTFESGVKSFFAQRHHIAYDYAIIPCPVWIN